MIQIQPYVDHQVHCPGDGHELRIHQVAIPGMRCLVDATCPHCHNRYYVDLPSGQALWSPIMLNQATAELYDPLEIHWFSQPLRTGFLHPVEAEIVPKVQQFFRADRIILLNCLDFLYGHSLLKLLNVQRHLDESPELGCCVLVPTQLVHLVPEGVAEIWEFPVPIKEGSQWYSSLQRWIADRLTQYQQCYLSPAYSHPNNRAYDLKRFAHHLPNISESLVGFEPVILFSYREDRLWGRTLAGQQWRLQKLYDQLSQVFPKMAFVLLGFGHKNQLRTTGAKVIDLRTDRFDVERDRLWMAYMEAADCAIGVHGSNMLLPSGLAKSMVELVPADRQGNVAQDLLFGPEVQNPYHSLLFYRLLYGNRHVSNISSSLIVSTIATLLSAAITNAFQFQAGEVADLPEKSKLAMNRPSFIQASNAWKHQIKRPWLTRQFFKFFTFTLNTLQQWID